MSGRSAAACAEERERENKGARPLPPGRPADPPLALVAAGGHHQPPLQVLQRGVAGSAAAAGHVCRRKARARGHSYLSCATGLSRLLACALALSGPLATPSRGPPCGCRVGVGWCSVCVWQCTCTPHVALQAAVRCSVRGCTPAGQPQPRRAGSSTLAGWLASGAQRRSAAPRRAPAAPAPPPRRMACHRHLLSALGALAALVVLAALLPEEGGGAGAGAGWAAGGTRGARRPTRRPGPGPPPRGRQLTNPNALHCEAGRSRPTRRVPRGGWLCPRLRC